MDKNALSRRTFLELVGAFSATSALAACGSQRASEASGSDAGAAAGIADTITFSQGAEPRGLDPAFVDDMESAKVMVQIYETLLAYEDDSCTVIPSLAELPEVSDDGLTYTFKLKEGVKFHDGTDWNSEVAKLNIDRQLEPNRTDDMPYASFTYGAEADGNGIESVEAVDDYTIVIKLRAASTAFLANLAMIMPAGMMSPASFETAMENPVGTGQYKFVSWTKNSNIVLERNEEYWNPDRAGKTKNVIFTFIAEAASRVTALNNGEADLIDGIDEAVVDTVTAGGSLIYERDGMNVNYMAFNTASEQFSTAEARKAVAKAINVPELVESLYNGYASYANSIMPLWMAPYCEGITQTQYDAAAAKEECEKLGIKSIKCITYSNPRPYNGKGGQVLAETIQGYLAEIGVDMTIDTYDWTTYKTKVETENYDVCFYGWNGDNGDPDNFLNLLADSSPAMNVSRYNNPEYKSLIIQALETPAGDERDELYRQCEELLAEDCVWLPLSHSKNLMGYGPTVEGFVYHPTAVVYLWNTTKSV